jgi:hypothetical protein
MPTPDPIHPHYSPIQRAIREKIRELGGVAPATRALARVGVTVGRAQIASYVAGVPIRRGTVMAIETGAELAGWTGSSEEAERAYAKCLGITVPQLRARLGGDK